MRGASVRLRDALKPVTKPRLQHLHLGYRVSFVMSLLPSSVDLRAAIMQRMSYAICPACCHMHMLVIARTSRAQQWYQSFDPCQKRHVTLLCFWCR